MGGGYRMNCAGKPTKQADKAGQGRRFVNNSRVCESRLEAPLMYPAYSTPATKTGGEVSRRCVNARVARCREMSRITGGRASLTYLPLNKAASAAGPEAHLSRRV